jgi:dihydroorotate dehydrogenase (fumarate)
MDLSTNYMGLRLANPLVASASPLSKDIRNIEALAKAGAGAIVFHSVFQEQIDEDTRAVNYYLEQGTERFWESLTYFPPVNRLIGPEQYLQNIQLAKKAVGIPIIGSINCFSVSGWMEYAREIQQAGADGIELNVYFLPTSATDACADVERVYVDVLSAVKSAVTIPVAVKLSPFFSSIPNVVARLCDAGANGLVLFNRFYQPDIDVENLEVHPRLVLSNSEEIRLPMRWIAILHGRAKCSLAGSTGVHTGMDAAKMILAGADAVMMTSALLQHGIGHLATVTNEMVKILEEKEYTSISEARGVMSQKTVADPSAFERANYMKTLQGYDTPWESV